MFAIYFSEWVAKHSYASCVSVSVCERDIKHVRVCVYPPCVCVCASLCFGSGSMCVRVRGEVSLGWPWLESWRRAEVKEEICRKDTHHFPHYYFFFFFFYFYVFVSHSFFFCPRFFSPLPLPLPSPFLLCLFFTTVFLT